MNKKKLHPDRILDYFRAEWKVLALITVSGLIYNLGLMAEDPERGGAVPGNAPAGVCLRDRDRAGAAGQIHQAVLCAPVCQQCEQENEEDPLPDAGT